MPQRLRIFVSSPGDVPDERLRADLIVDKLSQEYGRFFTIESYRWEHEPMLASGHFQDAIEPPSAFDIVVLILWSRLGTPLPEKYRGIDGRTPVTGTEWEYEEALKVARERKAPDLLAFRNISPTPIDPRDPDNQTAQLKALNAFWRRHFADRGVFLAAYDEYQTLEDFAQRLEQSLRKLIERRIKDASTGEPRTEPIWFGDPYRGLESYEFEHAPIFFGRNAAITKATEQLAGNARSGTAFLLVSGPSGSGKSSLVKAGVVPRLMKPQRISGVAFLRRVVFPPGSEGIDPILGLAKALTRGVGNDVGLPELIAPGQDAAQLATHLRNAASDLGYLFANALGRLTEVGRKAGRILAFEDAKLILVVDQLEELFTVPQTGPEDRRLFIQLLASLARSGAVWVIATLRADFWHRAAEIPGLVALAEGQGRIDLATSSGPELAEMIRKPAQAAGLGFETHPESGLGLDAVLADDAAAAPGALPLLSFTLDELYKNARGRGEAVLSHASYLVLGGLEGAIAKRADEIMAGLPATARAALPRVLRALAAVTDGINQAPVARPTQLEAFGPGSPARTLIDGFISARLLVAAGKGDQSATVRLAHEALISRWKSARDQLATDRRDLETRNIVERAFGRWNPATGRARRSLLLRNPDLANAIDLAKRWGDDLEIPIRDFINRSARRARLAQTLTATAAVVFALVACVAALFFWFARVQTLAAIANESRALTALSRVALEDGRPNQAAQLALAAWPRSESDQHPRLETTLQNLSRVVSAGRLYTHQWQHKGPVDGALLTKDGTRMLSWSWDHTLRLWDIATGQQIGSAMRHGNAVNGARLTKDETRILSWSIDNTLRLWDVATGRQIGPAMKHEDSVEGALLTKDETRILSWSDDHTLRLWDVATGQQIGPAMKHDASVNGVLLTKDETRILSRSGNTVRLWDVATGQQIGPAMKHDASVNGVLLTKDETRILSRSGNTVRLWDVATGQQIGPAMKHDASVNGVLLTKDETRILSWSDDHTLRLWDITTGQQIGPAMKHDERVLEALLTKNETRILSWSNDHTLRLWDVATGQQIGPVMRHEDSVNGALLTKDENRILSWSNDHTLRLWDVATGQQIGPAMKHDERVLGALLTKNQTRILSWSADNTLRLWDVATGRQIGPAMKHDSVWGMLLTEDETRILSWSYDHTLRLWDVAIGQQIGPAMKHDERVLGALLTKNETRILSWSNDHTLRLWDVATGQQIGPVMRHGDSVNGALLTKDETRILSWSNDHTLRLWDVASGQQIGPTMKHEDSVNGALLTKDENRILSWSNDHTLRLWDITTGRQIGPAMRHEDSVNGALLTKDETRILSWSNDHTLRLWDVATGRQIGPVMKRTSCATLPATDKHRVCVEDKEPQVNGALLTNDETRILSWYGYRTLLPTGNMVLLWDVATGQQIGPGMHHAPVNGALLTKGETRILSWSDDNTLRLWDITTGQQVGPAMKHHNAVRSALLTKDETRILSWSDDNTLRLWDIASGQQIGPAMKHDERVLGALLTKNQTRILSWSADNTLRLWDVASGQQIGPAMKHDASVNGALLTEDETRILSWSADNTLRLWDARWPKGNLLEVTCALLPIEDRDASDTSKHYGVMIREPVCSSPTGTIVPPWSSIERAPADQQ